MAAGDTLHDRREDVARSAVRVAAGLLLDVADHHRALVAHLVLELLEEDLLGLADAQARDSLQLPQLALARLLELLRLILEVALAVLERALPPLQLAQPDVDRLFLGQDALLRARQLHPPLAELVLDV